MAVEGDETTLVEAQERRDLHEKTEAKGHETLATCCSDEEAGSRALESANEHAEHAWERENEGVVAQESDCAVDWEHGPVL